MGYDKHQTSDNINSRNGYNKKKLNSKYGQVDLKIPRDRDSSFEPQLVKKRETILELAKDWQARPLDQIYLIIFMDATVLKIRIDRVVKNIAVYIMLGVTSEGTVFG